MRDNQRKRGEEEKRLKQTVAAVTEATKQKTFSLHVSNQLRMRHKINSLAVEISQNFTKKVQGRNNKNSSLFQGNRNIFSSTLKEELVLKNCGDYFY